MTKEMRELMNQLETVKGEARALLGENKVADAEKKAEEARAISQRIAVQKRLDDLEDSEPRSGKQAGENRDEKDLETRYSKVFLKGLRRQRVDSEERTLIDEYRAMHAGGVGADANGNSSLIVPTDVQTSINGIMRTLNDLSNVFAHEDVTMLTGSRVLEKDDTMTPFAVVAEMGQIGETDNPKFIGVNYSLAKRAGILPLSNDLLKTSDQNVMGYVSRWIAKKHVVTKNTLLTTLLNTLAKVAVADLKAVKKVLNVTLDPAVSAASGVLTNQDGYQWLDEQVDANGRFLLMDDITQPGRKLLFGRPVVVVANRYLASEAGATTKAPLVIGNLQELLCHFSMGTYELKSTDVGGDAFKRDSTDLRAITYDDVQKWDVGSAVFGQLSIA